jgi:hypothetical protein
MVMTGEEAVMAKMLYGCGLRVLECLRLRVKDVDVSGGKVEVRGGKNDKDRVLTMPKSLVGLLEAQMQQCRVIHDKDREEGLAGVYLPGAYEVKNPAAGVGWPWFWLFPSKSLSADPRAGGLGRLHHAHEARVSRALAAAVKAAGLEKKVTAHTVRHSFATHLVLRGVDIRSVQELLGHLDIRTTMICEDPCRRSHRALTDEHCFRISDGKTGGVTEGWLVVVVFRGAGGTGGGEAGASSSPGRWPASMIMRACFQAWMKRGPDSESANWRTRSSRSRRSPRREHRTLNAQH